MGAVHTINLWGGINNLLSIIGHFEKETDSRKFDKTKSTILDQLHGDVIESYYQIIGRANQWDIDRVLDAFWELEELEKDFWKDFEKRINIALETDFDVEVKVTTRIKTKYATRFKAFIETFADWQARHLSETGKFASVDGTLQPSCITTALSNNQNKDYKELDYKCCDKVYIPGTVPTKRSNLIVVNGTNTKIGDSIFTLFLRLVVELKKKEGGWVNIHTLESENIISDPEKYQIYSNLRIQLQGSLLDKDGQKFIQSDGSKNYRISTHPDFITYDKEKLLNHPDQRIKELANKLLS